MSMEWDFFSLVNSGIGKSECVLDLVERGHRLVADDLVFATRRGHDIVIGHGHEVQRHHMEIRGVGIIDVKALFGIRAIRQQKRIEVVVQLEAWDDTRDYTRTGLERETTVILGVTLPKVTVPLNPGKNITVISEVVAMNHLLKYSGVDPAVRIRSESCGRPCARSEGTSSRTMSDSGLLVAWSWPTGAWPRAWSMPWPGSPGSQTGSSMPVSNDGKSPEAFATRWRVCSGGARS